MSILLDKDFIERLSIELEKSLIDATAVFAIVITRKELTLRESFNDEVICSISVTGAFNGNLIIAIPQKLACQFVSKMLGEVLEEVNDDVLDGCREIMNIVMGGLKTGMSDQGLDIIIGLPTSLNGQTLHMRFNPSDVIIRQQYSSLGSDFEMFLVCRQNESHIHERHLDKLKNNPHAPQQ